MNCSAISLARSATNGCALNGAFRAVPNVTMASVTNGTVAPTTNGINAKNAILVNNGTTTANLHTLNGNQLKQNTNHINKSSTSENPTNTTATATTTTTISTDSQDKCKNVHLAAKIVQQSQVVCFDVDSTVIVEEGIDELADFCGKGAEVSRVTKEAMGGAMTFQDALTIRLNIIRPTQQQIIDFIKQRPSTLTCNVKRFIEQLKADGKQVYLISGGFDYLIEPVAQELNLPMSHLYANKLMFYHNGEYAHFDINQPTSKSGGKAVAVGLIKQQHPDALITMIGDGATDLEAVPPANYFIGFGGNVVRAEVQKRAQYYVTDFEQLM